MRFFIRPAFLVEDLSLLLMVNVSFQANNEALVDVAVDDLLVLYQKWIERDNYTVEVERR